MTTLAQKKHGSRRSWRTAPWSALACFVLVNAAPNPVHAQSGGDEESADIQGRQYAWKTFHERFDPELNRPYCLNQTPKMFESWWNLVKAYLLDENRSRARFHSTDNAFLEVSAKYRDCVRYLAMTKQGRLYADRDARARVEAALTDVEMAMTHLRIAHNELDPEAVVLLLEQRLVFFSQILRESEPALSDER